MAKMAQLGSMADQKFDVAILGEISRSKGDFFHLPRAEAAARGRQLSNRLTDLWAGSPTLRADKRSMSVQKGLEGKEYL